MPVSNSSGSVKLKYDDVVKFILSEESRRKSSSQVSTSALNSEKKGRNKNKGSKIPRLIKVKERQTENSPKEG